MSNTGVNLAVTLDGEPYNKLRRPNHFLGPPTGGPSTNPPSPTAASAEKRKREEDEGIAPEEENETHTKRPRVYTVPKKTGKSGSNRKAKDAPGRLPVSEDERSSDDECTIQARAFLRGAREEERILNRALLLVDAPQQARQAKADKYLQHDGLENDPATYQHGYYFARETQSREDTSKEHADPQPQEHYYKMLLKRYRAMRNSLANDTSNRNQPVPQAKIQPPQNRHEWLYILNRDYPTPAQVNKLDDHNVARGLKYSAHGMDRSESISKQKSCWIWALLAKVGEVDTMLSEQISPIRELALKAGQLSIRIRGVDPRQLDTENEDEEAEYWEVDDIEPDYEGSEHSSDDGSEPIDAESELLVRKVEHLEEDSRMLADGMKAAEEVTETPDISMENEQDPKQGDGAGSGADMSMSEDGEIQDDEEPATLEEARARLFAQLGDRLVQPQTDSIPQGQKSHEVDTYDLPEKVRNQSDMSRSATSPPSRQGGRHKHNGKFCHDSSCAVEKRRRISHQNAGRRAAQGNVSQRERSTSPHERPLPSRAEAEAQRQAMRKAELHHVEPKYGVESSNGDDLLNESSDSNNTSGASKSTQKVFASRAEAEDYRQAQRELETLPNPKTAPELATHEDVQMEQVDISDLNTRVTIDMILTIAAECYGQKDLLKYRDSWVK